MALLNTDRWTWIQEFDSTENGRHAWQALESHYDRPGETEKRIALAQNTLKTLHYRSKRHAINFKTYATCMMDAFTILQENGMNKSGLEHVDYLLKGIDSSAHPLVHNAKTFISMHDTLKANFVGAINKLSEYITKETPALEIYSPRGQGGRHVASFH